MEKIHARELCKQAVNLAAWFSNPQRQKNVNNDTYTIKEIHPLNAQMAIVEYDKYPSGGKAIAWFHLIIYSKDKFKWFGYFVTAAHMVNLDKIQDIYYRIEGHNFPHEVYGNG